jgi:hypothetical protein
VIGRVLSASIHRPGNAAAIAKNGWSCSFPGCNAVPTVEIRFTREARGLPGYTVGSHGTCAEHAKAHARSLRANVPEAVEG